MSAETKTSVKGAVEIAMEAGTAIKEQREKMEALQNQRQRLRVHLDRFPSLRERFSSLPLAAVGNADEETKLNNVTRAQLLREIEKTLAEARESVSCVIAPGAIEQIQNGGLDKDKFEPILRHIASLEASIDNAAKLYTQHAANDAAASETTLENDSKPAAEKGLAELVKDVARLAEALETAEKQTDAHLQSSINRLSDVLAMLQLRVEAPEEKSNLAARELEKTQEISINNLELIKLIGEGGYGKVYQGVWRPFGTKVAVKVIDNGDLSDLQALDIQTEMEFLKNLSFEHVVRYFGTARDASRFCVVMELMEGGSLQSIIHSDNPLPWPKRVNLAKQSAVPLVYLHSRNIVHSDVKPNNFLVDRNSTVKICDFGLTAIVRASQTNSVLAGGPTGGTLQWMAPERLTFVDGGNREFGKPSTKSDVFSFGVLLWEFATRATPYEGYRAGDLVDLVTSGRRLPIPKETPPAFARLIEDCWAQDPSMRPTMQEVLDRLTSLDDPNAPAPAPSPSPAPAPQPPASPAHNSDRVQGPSNPASEASRGSGPGAQSQARAARLYVPRGPSDEHKVPTNFNSKPDLMKTSEDGWSVADLIRAANNLFTGNGCAVNKEKAAQLIEKAANLGFAPAMAQLGMLYLSGTGVPRDHEMSFKCFVDASEHGDTNSMGRIAEMYWSGMGVTENHMKALEFASKAVELDQDDGAAWLVMGKCLMEGTTPDKADKDVQRGIRCLERAADLHVHQASSDLGIHFTGQRNPEAAFKWFLISAQDGNASAMRKVALAYAHGFGCEEDPVQSAIWYQRALEATEAMQK